MMKNARQAEFIWRPINWRVDEGMKSNVEGASVALLSTSLLRKNQIKTQMWTLDYEAAIKQQLRNQLAELEWETKKKINEVRQLNSEVQQRPEIAFPRNLTKFKARSIVKENDLHH